MNRNSWCESGFNDSLWYTNVQLLGKFESHQTWSIIFSSILLQDMVTSPLIFKSAPTCLIIQIQWVSSTCSFFSIKRRKPKWNSDNSVNPGQKQEAELGGRWPTLSRSTRRSSHWTCPTQSLHVSVSVKENICPVAPHPPFAGQPTEANLCWHEGGHSSFISHHLQLLSPSPTTHHPPHPDSPSSSRSNCDPHQQSPTPV